MAEAIEDNLQGFFDCKDISEHLFESYFCRKGLSSDKENFESSTPSNELETSEHWLSDSLRHNGQLREAEEMG